MKIDKHIVDINKNICKNNNWKIITPESEFYPQRLLNILNKLP